jgi:hypothetical protein
MKKSILKIVVLLSVFAVLATSCSKDGDDDITTLKGKYTLTMDGKTVASGETVEVGMIGNAVSLSEGEDFGVVIAGVPESTGGTAEVGDQGTGCSVIISGKNLLESGADEMYFSISGTVKRTSGNKITFEGSCTDLSGGTHTFSGTAESDAYKII